VTGVVRRLADHGGGPLETRERLGQRLRVERSLAIAKMLGLAPVRVVLPLWSVASGDLAEQDRPDSLVASFVGDSEITVAGLSKRAKRP
jgi:hypothetical protein